MTRVLGEDGLWRTANASTDISGLAAVATSGSASDLATGTVPTARLGSGAPDGTKFLRGDQVWAAPSAGAGDVTGPVSSTDNAIARFDLTTGKLLQNSAVTVDDAGNIATAGTVDGRDVSVDGTKLDGVASGATANATDAALRDRATHTGTQAAATVTGLAAIATSGSASDLSTGTTPTARLGSGTANSTTYLRGDQTWAAIAGGGDVVGPASSVDNEIALFSGTGGKTIKRASTTGVVKASSGVIAAAVEGTDYPRPYVLVATLAGDQATGANTTPVTLTGLVWTFVANAVYFFEWRGDVAPAAAGTGCGFQIDVSVAVTQISMTFFHQLANTGTLAGGSSIADDASAGVSTGMPAASATPVAGFGLLRVGANGGTAQMRFRAEVAAVTTAKAGMTLLVRRLA